VARWVFGILFFLYLLVMGREQPWADAHVMYRQAQAIVERQSLQIVGMDQSPPDFFIDHDGKRYSLYPLGSSLALIPSYLVYKLAIQVGGAPNALLFAWAAKLSAAAAGAAACALFLILLRREGIKPRRAAALALTLGAATIMVIYARVAYSETLQAALYLWIVLLCLELKRSARAWPAAQLGFAVGWLLNVKAVNVFALGLVALWLAWQLRPDPKRLLAVAGFSLLTLVPWIVLMLGTNYVKTGSPFETGYATANRIESIFSGRGYDALYGYLFSPGKGVFFFSPILLLGVFGLRAYFRERRAPALLLTGIVVGVIGPHLFFPSWYGGLVWGPRYLVPITPLLLLPAAWWLEQAWTSRWRRVAVIALGAASVGVQILGCCFWWGMYQRIVKLTRGAGPEHLSYTSTVFNPTMSPIVGHAWMLKHWILDDPDLDRDCPFRDLLDPVPDMNAHANVPIDFWAHHWYTQGGTPRRWFLVMATVFGLGLVGCGMGLRRQLRV
jgi:hypothetical protein